MEETPVIWTEITRDQLERIYIFIARDFILQADAIFNKIVESTSVLAAHPYKYKMDNDGSFRAYELHRLRISYEITKSASYIHSTHQKYLSESSRVLADFFILLDST